MTVLAIAAAVFAASAAVAAVLHELMPDPFAEQPRELSLDEHLLELAHLEGARS